MSEVSGQHDNDSYKELHDYDSPQGHKEAIDELLLLNKKLKHHCNSFKSRYDIKKDIVDVMSLISGGRQVEDNNKGLVIQGRLLQQLISKIADSNSKYIYSGGVNANKVNHSNELKSPFTNNYEDVELVNPSKELNPPLTNKCEDVELVEEA